MVELIHTAFREEDFAEEADWQEVVLIPKGGGDYRDIGLVGLMWKAVAVILIRHFTAFITYPDSLHGLWAGRGTGTATLEVKLINQVAALRDALELGGREIGAKYRRD